MYELGTVYPLGEEVLPEFRLMHELPGTEDIQAFADSARQFFNSHGKPGEVLSQDSSYRTSNQNVWLHDGIVEVEFIDARNKEGDFEPESLEVTMSYLVEDTPEFTTWHTAKIVLPFSKYQLGRWRLRNALGFIVPEENVPEMIPAFNQPLLVNYPFEICGVDDLSPLTELQNLRDEVPTTELSTQQGTLTEDIEWAELKQRGEDLMEELQATGEFDAVLAIHKAQAQAQEAAAQTTLVSKDTLTRLTSFLKDLT